MYAMQMDSDIASVELQNGLFGTGGQTPSILANPEFDCFDDASIYEDYCGLNIYGENFSPPSSSALNESTITTHPETFTHDQDHLGIGVHDGPHVSQYLGSMETNHSKAEKKNGHRRSMKKAVKISPREMLKAYSVLHPSASKDGHTKVATSRGLRDRRIRLSFETAIKFFLVQDRLGFDQPSKALEWLIDKCKPAIEELPKVPSYGPLTKESHFSTDPHNYRADYVMESFGISQASMEPCTMEGPIPIDSTFSGDQSHIDIFSCLYPSFDCGECEMQTSTVNSSIVGLNSTVTPTYSAYSATNHHPQL